MLTKELETRTNIPGRAACRGALKMVLSIALLLPLAAAADSFAATPVEDIFPGPDMYRTTAISGGLFLFVGILTASLFRSRRLQQSRQRLQKEVGIKDRALAELCSSVLHLRQLTDNIDAVLFSFSPDRQRIEYLSPVFEKWWGFPAARLQREPDLWTKAIHPQDLSRVSQEVARLKQGGITDRQLIEAFRIIDPDGRLRWIQAWLHPAPATANGPRAICGIVEDITEQVQARERLTRVLNEYQAITNNVRDIIFKLSPNGQVLWCNRQLQGFAARAGIADPTGISIYELLSGKDRGTLSNVLLLTRKIGEARVEIPFRSGIGETLYQLSTVYQQGDETQQEAIVCIGRDITYQRQAELETAELQKQLQHAQKMEAIGNLTGGIAHDFNNILSSILGYADLGLLRNQGSADPKISEYFTEVIRAGKRATSLVDKMLTFTRSEPLDETASIALPAALDDILQLMRPVIPASINFKTTIEADNTQVSMSEVDFQQVIMNLLINARDAMQERGTIEIDCRPVDIAAMECSSCKKTFFGKYLQVSVTDHGPGILATDIENVFNPFFTTKKPGKGTGLGLSVIHGVIHSRHGHIRLINQPGLGCTFQLFLTLCGEELQPQRPRGPARDILPPDEGHNRILLVDDEKNVGLYMKELLQKNGYLVDYRTDPVEALNVYSNLPQNFDLVITDQTMPHITGMDLARHVKNLRPECPVILCTGFSDILNHQHLEEFGIPLCHKPLDSQDLLGHVSRLLH